MACLGLAGTRWANKPPPCFRFTLELNLSRPTDYCRARWADFCKILLFLTETNEWQMFSRQASAWAGSTDENLLASKIGLWTVVRLTGRPGSPLSTVILIQKSYCLLSIFLCIDAAGCESQLLVAFFLQRVKVNSCISVLLNLLPIWSWSTACWLFVRKKF